MIISTYFICLMLSPARLLPKTCLVFLDKHRYWFRGHWGNIGPDVPGVMSWHWAVTWHRQGILQAQCQDVTLEILEVTIALGYFEGAWSPHLAAFVEDPSEPGDKKQYYDISKFCDNGCKPGGRLLWIDSHPLRRLYGHILNLAILGLVFSIPVVRVNDGC